MDNINVSINTDINEQTAKAVNSSRQSDERYKVIMGMVFDTYASEIPDFGSVRLVDSNGQNANQYLLNSEDIDKLDLITNAGDGSLAYCMDTKTLYARHENMWKEV